MKQSYLKNEEHLAVLQINKQISNSSNNVQQNISVQVKQESNNDSNNNLSKTIPVIKTVATVTPSSNNSQVQGNEPSSCSISKKKGIVRGAKFFQQRKLEQDQEKKQLVQSHSQSNSQVKVEFEEITFQPSFLSKAKQTISSSSLNNQDKVIESRNGQPQESLNIQSQEIQKKLKIKKEEKEDIQIDTSYSNKTTDKVDLDKIQLKQEAVIPPTKSIWVSKKGLKLSNQQNQGAKDNSNNKTTTSKIDVKIEQVAPKQQELPKKELRNKKRPADLSYFVVDTSGDDDYDDEEDDDIDDGDEFEQEDSFENSKHRPSRLLVKEENNTKQKSSLTGVLQQSPSESKSKIKNPQILNNKSSLSTTSMVTRQEIKQQPQPISNQTPKQLNSSVQQSTIPQTRQQQLLQQQYVPLSNIKQQPQQQLQPQQQQQPTIVSQPQQKSTFFNTTSNSDFQSRTPQGNNNFSFINNVLNGNNSNFIPSSNPAFLDYKMPKTIFTQPFNTPVSILNNAPQTSNMNNNNNINSGFNNNNNNNNSQISSIMSFIRESDRGFLSQMLEKTKQDNNNANKVSNGNPSRQLL